MKWKAILTKKIEFKDAEINSYKMRKGDYAKAEWLIINTDKSNKEIALESGVSKQRIPPLRQQIRR